MSKTTPATVALTKAGVAFSLFPYDYDPNAPRVGLQAAEALGVAPEQVFKTLMVLVDGAPACVIVPSDCEVSMKKLAAVLGAKSPSRWGRRTIWPSPNGSTPCSWKTCRS